MSTLGATAWTKEHVIKETWTQRDLPVLTAVVEAFERGLDDGFPHVPDIARDTGLPPSDVARSLSAMDGEYVDFVVTMSGGDPTPWFVQQIYPAARRAVGQWPSTEDLLVGRLALALQQVAEHTTDPTEKGRLRQAAEAIGGLTQKVLVEVGARMLEHQIGMA